MLESLSFKNYNYFPIQTKEKGRRAECLCMGRENYVPSGSGLGDEFSLQRQHRKELNIFIFLILSCGGMRHIVRPQNLKYVGAQRWHSLFHSKRFTFASSEGHLLRLCKAAFLKGAALTFDQTLVGFCLSVQFVQADVNLPVGFGSKQPNQDHHGDMSWFILLGFF